MSAGIHETDLGEILGYRITQYRRARYGRVIDTYYHIRDKGGELHGKPFIALDEPVQLLREIEASLVAPGKMIKIPTTGRLR